MEQKSDKLLKLSRELREKIENFSGDVVLLDICQPYVVRYSMTPEEVAQSCLDGILIAEKIPNSRFLGQFGAINGKLLVQVAVDENVPSWKNPDYMNKPATFPMTAQEREILNSK